VSISNYYISDLHVNHKNILAFDNRPYFSVEEMNTALIHNWNEIVTAEDSVYVLGDVSWDSKENTLKFLSQLNGKKYLIRGNHDTEFQCSNKPSQGFAWIKDYAEIVDNGKHIVLSHYPIPCYKNMYYGWYMLYGHVHSTTEDVITEHYFDSICNYYEFPRKSFNVGCMKNWMQFAPRTLDQIEDGYNKYKEIIKERLVD